MCLVYLTHLSKHFATKSVFPLKITFLRCLCTFTSTLQLYTYCHQGTLLCYNLLGVCITTCNVYVYTHLVFSLEEVGHDSTLCWLNCRSAYSLTLLQKNNFQEPCHFLLKPLKKVIQLHTIILAVVYNTLPALDISIVKRDSCNHVMSKVQADKIQNHFGTFRHSLLPSSPFHSKLSGENT